MRVARGGSWVCVRTCVHGVRLEQLHELVGDARRAEVDRQEAPVVHCGTAGGGPVQQSQAHGETARTLRHCHGRFGRYRARVDHSY
eukprot:5978610-Pleurochrysis_carterae.AAC.1